MLQLLKCMLFIGWLLWQQVLQYKKKCGELEEQVRSMNMDQERQKRSVSMVPVELHSLCAKCVHVSVLMNRYKGSCVLTEGKWKIYNSPFQKLFCFTRSLWPEACTPCNLVSCKKTSIFKNYVWKSTVHNTFVCWWQDSAVCEKTLVQVNLLNIKMTLTRK